jgi:hypothetical protein
MPVMYGTISLPRRKNAQKQPILAALEPLRDGEIYRFKTHMRLAVGVKI